MIYGTYNLIYIYRYPSLSYNISIDIMENHHAIKNGKPSISKGHLYHGYVK